MFLIFLLAELFCLLPSSVLIYMYGILCNKSMYYVDGDESSGHFRLLV